LEEALTGTSRITCGFLAQAMLAPIDALAA
jgi:hypothetical protein